MKYAESILDLIGNTPMVKINRMVNKSDALLLVKLEWYNIGGSVKDRLALRLIEEAEREGRIGRDTKILEASSGNTGIALAMIAAAKGYRTTIVMPESVSVERRKIIRAYGAELVLSPAAKGTGGAVEMKRQMLKKKPNEYVDVDQFRDPANISIHYETTAREILEQTNGNVDAIVVGIGTAGTGMGISRRVKEVHSDTQVIGVMPRLGVRIEGLRNPDEPNPTQLFERDCFHEIVEIAQEELGAAAETARILAKEEGLLVGTSSGAIVHVALRSARHLGSGKTVVAVLPDSGLKYLSTPLYE